MMRFSDKREKRRELTSIHDVPEGIKAFPEFEEYPLGEIPDRVFRQATQGILANRDWHEYNRLAFKELEELDKRFSSARARQDSTALAERHGVTRALLEFANEAKRQAIDPGVVEAIRDDQLYFGILSELYLAGNDWVKLGQLREATNDGDHLEETVSSLAGADLALASTDSVRITPRGELALEKSLNLH